MSFIVVSPLSQLAAQFRLHQPSHVVTLTSDEVAELPSAGIERLVLQFNDIVEPRKGLTQPDADHVQKLLDFVGGWDRKSPLLIHCYAGVSRSPAAAYIAKLALETSADETMLAHALRKLAPSATPNIRLIALADQLLGRNGRMVEAIQSIGRGAEAYEGEVFSLPVIG